MSTTANMSLEQLLRHKEEVERAIREKREAERAKGIEEIVAIMTRLELTPKDLGFETGAKKKGATSKAKATKVGPTTKVGRARSTKGQKVPPKYRDPDTGNQWTGRGLMPQWLRSKIDEGRKQEDFLIV